MTIALENAAAFSDADKATFAAAVGACGGDSIARAVTAKQAYTEGPLGANANLNAEANAIVADVSGSVVAGGVPANPNLIGYNQPETDIAGDGVTTTFTSDFSASGFGITTSANVKVLFIRADKVRVTLTNYDPAVFGFVIVNDQVQITYPLSGHNTNNGSGGGEGSNPFVLPTETIIIQARNAVALTGCGSDYSSVNGGYDTIVKGGAMTNAFGVAHGRFFTFGPLGASNGDHNCMVGGSYHQIWSGYYGIIAGGTGNVIKITGTGASGSGALGGSFNTISGPSAGAVFSSSSTASGSRALLLGASNSTASGNRAAVGGSTNVGSGSDSFTFGNTVNNAGNYSAAFGFQTTISADYSLVAGRQSSVTGQYSVAFGLSTTAAGQGALATGKSAIARNNCSHTIGAGQNAAQGDAQTSVTALRGQTTDATPTNILADSGSAAPLTVPNNTTWAFTALVAGRRAGSTFESAAFEIKGIVINDAGTLRFIGGSPAATVLGRDDATWGLQLALDQTNKRLSVQVIGAAAKNISWAGRFTSTEVSV